MYQQNPQYQGYQPVPPPMRPPTHPPPPLSIPGLPQSQYSQYNINTSPANSIQMRQQQNMPPPSPSESSERAGPEEEYFNLPGPKPTSHIWGGYIWALEVVQHPQRARMCGFGDKDRRPISPPPCIRLVILNPNTKEEADYHDIDLTHLVLTVDIWDLGATREMNLVKQSNASPCISSAATGAYPTTATPAPPNHEQPRPYDVSNIPGYPQHQYASPSTPGGSNNYCSSNQQGYPPRPAYMNGQNGHPPPYQNGSSVFPRPSYPYPDPRYGTSQPQAQQSQFPLPPNLQPVNPVMASMEHTYVHQPPASTQLYTRNLIGSLCASAFRLKDENDKWGIWFVLQDLSVRTEGWFRLKMNFFNISQAVQKQIQDATNGTQHSSGAANVMDTAPCLASTFSNPFRVYSAKKFPGVVESTLLSKAFANQGIKIPIRKDTGGKRGRDDSDDEGSGAED